MFRHSFDTKTRVLLEMIVQGGSIESVYHCCTYSLKVSGGFSGSNFKAVSKKSLQIIGWRRTAKACNRSIKFYITQ